MTLSEWAETYDRIVFEHPVFKHKFVHDLTKGRSDLWHLTDYVVTSCIAGTIWLTLRKQQ